MKLALTGATGFIGKELLKHLPETVTEVRVLSRNAERAEALLSKILSPVRRERTRAYSWDAEKSVAPATALRDIDVVIHLAGENVGAGRWTPEMKRRIRTSRELGTRNLVAGLNRLPRPPVLISASAIGYYGDAGEARLDEKSPRGSGFLAEVCEAWEKEARAAKVARLVIPRLGVVFGEGGGALEKLLPVFRAGVGGRIGDGQQWMSWIHRDDVIEFLIRAVSDPKIEGTYNLTAPEVVRNETFAQTLGRALHRPAVLPVPKFALRLAMGEMAEQTILTSQRVTCDRLLATGFQFKFPKLLGALQQIAKP